VLAAGVIPCSRSRHRTQATRWQRPPRSLRSGAPGRTARRARARCWRARGRGQLIYMRLYIYSFLNIPGTRELGNFCPPGVPRLNQSSVLQRATATCKSYCCTVCLGCADFFERDFRLRISSRPSLESSRAEASNEPSSASRRAHSAKFCSSHGGQAVCPRERRPTWRLSSCFPEFEPITRLTFLSQVFVYYTGILSLGKRKG
jgi:hypothetical protein